MSGVRIATFADALQIERIVKDAYQPWVAAIGARPRPMDVDHERLIEAGSVYVTGEPEPIGLIVLSPEPDTMLVENVAVRPDRQGEGIGRSLLAFAEATAKDHGLYAARLFTHQKMTENIRFYQFLGYEITGSEDVAGGPLVHMRKTLMH